MGLSFLDKYQSETTWFGRAMVMEIFHLAAMAHDRTWTVTRTAAYFEVSVGLASENLKLAEAIHENEKIMAIPTRYEALRRIR